jgi:hypothetical protein
MNTIDRGSVRAQAPHNAPNTADSAAEIDYDKSPVAFDPTITNVAADGETDYLIDPSQDCSPCFSDIEKQRLFIAFVQQNVRTKSVPAPLAATIRQGIAQEVSA